MARRKPKPARRRRRRRAAPTPAPVPAPPPARMNAPQVATARRLFWENVIREILTSLSMLCALRSTASEPPADEHAAEAQADAAAMAQEGYDPALFDGRLAVITRAGERVAIADVAPLFACGINTPQDRGLSIAVECTVFQISTPDGHVYTLPLHEIRAFHAMTPELMRRLERSARRRRTSRDAEDEQAQPFGFAAFTSMMQPPPKPLEPPPAHPTE